MHFRGQGMHRRILRIEKGIPGRLISVRVFLCPGFMGFPFRLEVCMKLTEQMQLKLTTLSLKDWDSFQVALRLLRRADAV